MNKNPSKLKQIADAIEAGKGLTLGALVDQVVRLTKDNNATKDAFEKTLTAVKVLQDSLSNKTDNENLTQYLAEIMEYVNDIESRNIETTKKAVNSINATISNLQKELKRVEENQPDIFEQIVIERVEKAPISEEQKLDIIDLALEKIESTEKYKSFISKEDYMKGFVDLQNMIAVKGGEQYSIPMGLEVFYNGTNVGRMPSINFIGGRVEVSLSRVDVYLGSGGGISDITGLIAEGSGISITGLGTLADPYVINATGGAATQWGDITGTITDQTDLVSYVASQVSASSYWTRDAGNGYVYTTTSTDNVGIGTSTPAGKLVVFDSTGGSLRVGNNSDGITLGIATGEGQIRSFDVNGTAFNNMYLQTGNSAGVFINTSGTVGINTKTLLASVGGLDIASGAQSFIVGADSGASTRTDATTKVARIGVPHYTNAEEPVALATVTAGNGNNTVVFGGGTSTLNAAVSLQFNTAANSTTVNGTARMFINNNGLVGIGTTSPSSTLGGLDIASGGFGIIVGADFNVQATRTTANTKGSRIGGYHYTNTEEPIGLLTYTSDVNENKISIGGGSSTTNAATQIDLYTASNTTTLAGTSRITILSNGNVGIGTTSGTSTATLGGLDIASGGLTLVLGATAGSQGTRTNSTNKTAMVGAYHYTNAEEPFGMLYGVSTTSSNILSVGGGTSSMNAATLVQFYTAANTTTVTGTVQATIGADGMGIGTATTTGSKLSISGTGDYTSGLLNLTSTSTNARGTYARLSFYSYFNMDSSGNTFWNWGSRYDGTANQWVRVYTSATNYLPYIKYATTSILGFGSAVSNLTTDANPTMSDKFVMDMANTRFGAGTTSPDRLLHNEAVDSGTNTVTYAQRTSHITSGSPTTGFGVGQEFELQNASGTNRVAATQEYSWSDATNTSEDTTWKLFLMRAGVLTEALEVQSTGALMINNAFTLPTSDGTANQVLVTNGAGVVSWGSASGANTTLSNLGTTAINTTLASDTNNTDDLGTSSIAWKDVYAYSIKLNGSSSGIGTLSAPGIASTYSWVLPAASDTLVGRATTDTLTNKTLGTTTMSDSADIVLGSTTGTKIGTATTQKLGFFNATPVVQPSAYTASNVSTDRSYDANATTMDELADVVGTLITDLKSLGLIG